MTASRAAWAAVGNGERGSARLADGADGGSFGLVERVAASVDPGGDRGGVEADEAS